MVTIHGEKVALKELACIDPLPTVPTKCKMLFTVLRSFEVLAVSLWQPRMVLTIIVAASGANVHMCTRRPRASLSTCRRSTPPPWHLALVFETLTLELSPCHPTTALLSPALSLHGIFRRQLESWPPSLWAVGSVHDAPEEMCHLYA